MLPHSVIQVPGKPIAPRPRSRPGARAGQHRRGPPLFPALSQPRGDRPRTLFIIASDRAYQA